ncbi:conserved hypothetical protein [Parafrankia sp. Ea1.12]|uniref:hypothetical protein n=1 Tax=Parafrankia sp. Ea1.12 TaxID=573499 RepID=UPI000DA48FD2|nr:hypothetical protein [Parafrankia sp. Ea1.12]SQD93855.1 conserved hypothetical protein [Parafrankia sp. Ea1.12]
MASRRDVDDALALLRSETAALSTSLLELDATAEQVLGDVTRLRGRTAARAAVARAGLGWLWDRHRAVSEVLGRVEALRGLPDSRIGARQAARVDAFLREPPSHPPTPPPGELSAPLPRELGSAPGQLPAGATDRLPRSAAGNLPAGAAGRLLAGTREIAEAVRAELAAVTAARAAHHRILVDAARGLAETDAVCARLAIPDLPELVAARAAMGAAAAAVTANPLETTPDDLGPTIAAAAQVGELVAVLRRTFDGLDAELAAAEDMLHRIVSVAQEGERAARTVVERLTGDPTGLVRLGDGWFDGPRSGLRPWLDRLVAAGAAGEWRLVAHGLGAWHRVARETLAAAEETVTTNSAPLRRRDELRGLLGALRAKAGRLGQLESPHIGELYERAATALRTVPVDLDAAQALVTAFGDALLNIPPPPPAPAPASAPVAASVSAPGEVAGVSAVSAARQVGDGGGHAAWTEERW